MQPQASVKSVPQHLPELDGLRAVASLGIIVTHVSFQTGTGWGFAGRFDYFVAVFFALSAFLLWRRRGHLIRLRALARGASATGLLCLRGGGDAPASRCPLAHPYPAV